MAGQILRRDTGGGLTAARSTGTEMRQDRSTPPLRYLTVTPAIALRATLCKSSCKRMGLRMPKLSNERRRFLERATLQYQEHIHDAAPFLERRGLDLDYAESVGLGVVRNPEAQHLEYEGRLAIPYLTESGPVQMAFRCLEDHDCKFEGHPKLLRANGWPNRLYGVMAADEAEDWIAVAEGEIDAMILQMVGIPAVGVPGSEVFKDYWPNVFEDFSRVYIFADGDDAGDKMISKWRDRIDTAIISAKMPHKEDVNSMYLKEGADFLLGKIKR